MNRVNFYLLCQKVRWGTKDFIEVASNSLREVATNEETFLHLSRQQLFYKRITHTDYSLSCRDFSITHTQDMLETQALWFFEAWYRETNMAFFSNSDETFWKGEPNTGQVSNQIDIHKFLRF